MHERELVAETDTVLAARIDEQVVLNGREHRLTCDPDHTTPDTEVDRSRPSVGGELNALERNEPITDLYLAEHALDTNQRRLALASLLDDQNACRNDDLALRHGRA